MIIHKKKDISPPPSKAVKSSVFGIRNEFRLFSASLNKPEKSLGFKYVKNADGSITISSLLVAGGVENANGVTIMSNALDDFNSAYFEKLGYKVPVVLNHINECVIGTCGIPTKDAAGNYVVSDITVPPFVDEKYKIFQQLEAKMIQGISIYAFADEFDENWNVTKATLINVSLVSNPACLI